MFPCFAASIWQKKEAEKGRAKGEREGNKHSAWLNWNYLANWAGGLWTVCLIISLATFAACLREVVGNTDGDCAKAYIHISPDIGADIKRLLNKFKLIDKHTESQMVAASAAADGNYRHVLCSNQRSSRHLVKQFAGQMQPNQSRQRMPHAACHIAQVQPTHCPPVDRSGPV